MFGEWFNKLTGGNKKEFNDMTDGEIDPHCKIDRHGDFQLTDAIRPAPGGHFIPREGYNDEIYRHALEDIPLIMAAVTREKLFDTFWDLTNEMGNDVDVTLITSHDTQPSVPFHRWSIDLPVLQSVIIEYEDLLLNDGKTGIAIHNQRKQELQFDEHKLLLIFHGDARTSFESILREHGIFHNQRMKFITDDVHLHTTTDEYRQMFHEFCHKIGIDDSEKQIDEMLRKNP